MTDEDRFNRLPAKGDWAAAASPSRNHRLLARPGFESLSRSQFQIQDPITDVYSKPPYDNHYYNPHYNPPLCCTASK